MRCITEFNEPLNDDEMKLFRSRYVQDFDTMSVKEAIRLFRMIRNTGHNTFEPVYHDLLLRRLHMIIDWTNYPERLI